MREEIKIESEAYHTGYEAHEQGEPRSANPYEAGTWYAEQWTQGWDAAHEGQQIPPTSKAATFC